ncbi:Uncharacterised protein [Segatella buccae]|uniref:Uncharacterized protein n=1 Tax=Segatella buccae TaxID=28126 RepID=A0AAQ1UJ54_9BACT|nr:Uncharacterised protein [Segatella buccae]
MRIFFHFIYTSILKKGYICDINTKIAYEFT